MRAKLSHLLIAATVAGTALLASSSAAQAYDAWPCLGERYHPLAKTNVQTCPDWAPNNQIPVHEGPRAGSRIVGYINAAGDDWYVCHGEGASYAIRVGGVLYANNYWAYTYADNLKSGFVNEVYFRGGDNYEPDRKLRFCGW